MTMKLSESAVLRITRAQVEARKEAPANMADKAGIAAAIGAAVRETLAVVAAEMAEDLALIEDLQDRVNRLEEKQ